MSVNNRISKLNWCCDVFDWMFKYSAKFVLYAISLARFLFPFFSLQKVNFLDLNFLRLHVLYKSSMYPYSTT